MDIGVNLVENYLRLTGYLTLTEFEVQRRLENGQYATVTDVDIVAVRFPGEIYVGDPHDPHGDECGMLLIEDPALQLREDCVDVIIGEVKQGEASINANLTERTTLRAVLQRLSWLYAVELDDVITGLQEEQMHFSDSRGGATVRTRIVAFGQAPTTSLNILTHSHMIDTMLDFFDKFEEAFRPLQFKDPAPALLRLLNKVGYAVHRHQDGDEPAH